MRFSQFMKSSIELREQYKEDMSFQPRGTSMIAYVLMPNHFHFLLRQNTNSSISHYMKRVLDSYTKYFNTRYKRVGPLFQGQFKAVHIDSNNQLLHVSRYIHLNPYTSRIVHSMSGLFKYPWSSLRDYVKRGDTQLDTEPILLSFTKQNSYMEFIRNQADYQRNLHNLEHSLIEKVHH